MELQEAFQIVSELRWYEVHDHIANLKPEKLDESEQEAYVRCLLYLSKQGVDTGSDMKKIVDFSDENLLPIIEHSRSLGKVLSSYIDADFVQSHPACFDAMAKNCFDIRRYSDNFSDTLYKSLFDTESKQVELAQKCPDAFMRMLSTLGPDTTDVKNNPDQTVQKLIKQHNKQVKSAFKVMFSSVKLGGS